MMMVESVNTIFGTMGIVFITIYGDSEKAFANALHKETGRGVDLVLFEKPKPRKLVGRFRSMLAAARAGTLIREVWYGILLRLRRETGSVIRYFRESSPFESSPGYDPETLEVEDINSEETRAILERLSPDLIMVLGGSVLRHPVIQTAKKVVNLHMGLSPHYRGAVANQFAVLRRDAGRIGNTIHYVTNGVDTGDIIARIQADTTKPPGEMFRELNYETRKKYIDIAKRILAGEDVPAQKQDTATGDFFSLSKWTNEARYGVVSHILQWEREGRF